MADKLTSQQFAAKIRAKYPGAYDSVSDDELTQRVVTKYPDYAQSVQMPSAAAPVGLTPESLGVKPGIPGSSPKALQGAPTMADNLAAGRGEMPGSFEGKPGNTGQYIENGPGEMLAGGKDIAQGKVARGAHRVISGAGTTALPAAPFAIVAAPGAALRLALGGVAGSVVGEKGAEMLGANPDQAAFAGDIGGLVGGGVAQGGKNFFRPTAAMAEKIIGTLNKTAETEGLAPLTGKSLPKAFQSLSDQFIGRAKGNYQAVDRAVEGELQPVLDRIEELDAAIKATKNVDPAHAAKLEQELAVVQQNKANTIAKAQANGMQDAEAVVAQADKDYARGKALQAVTRNVKAVSGKVREGGKTNVSKFSTKIDNPGVMDKVTRGLDSDSLSEIQDAARTAFKTKKIHKVGAAVAGGTSLVGAGLYGAKKALLDK